MNERISFLKEALAFLKNWYPKFTTPEESNIFKKGAEV